MTTILEQDKLCEYCVFINKCLLEYTKLDEFKELKTNDMFKVDKNNSEILHIIEESLSNIYLMDAPNIAKLIADYGITNSYSENGYYDITHYYWGEIIKESPTFKSQSVLDPTHTYILKYKEWTKEVYESDFIIKKAYISKENNIMTHIECAKDGSRVSIKKVFEGLNFKRWKNMSVKVETIVSDHHNTTFYFEDDKYIHDSEFAKNKTLVGVTHLPKDINSKDYTIIDTHIESRFLTNAIYFISGLILGYTLLKQTNKNIRQ